MSSNDLFTREPQNTMISKNNLLKMIAESGYNVGFGAKKNFATFDILEKGAGWLGFLSLSVGLFSLVVPELGSRFVGATMVLVGVAALRISNFSHESSSHDKAGRALTDCFHNLRRLYYEVQSQPENSDFSGHLERHDDILRSAQMQTVSKQIFLSDWYAHLKFFWQNEIGWIEEQRKFSLLRDKLPLSFYVTALALVVWVLISIFD